MQSYKKKLIYESFRWTFLWCWFIWLIVNGQRSIVNGQRTIDNSQQSTVNGQQSIVDGQRTIEYRLTPCSLLLSPYSLLPTPYYYAIGSSMRKVVPSPSSELLTKILPWWYSSMMRLARESPSPQPRCLVV